MAQAPAIPRGTGIVQFAQECWSEPVRTEPAALDTLPLGVTILYRSSASA